MKKIILFATCFALFVAGKAQTAAYFSNCIFTTPDNKPYVETYLSVVGNSVSFRKNTQGKFQAQVEVGVLFSQGGQIKASKKYTLMSPEVTDTLHRQNFIDQQRFALEPGEYDFEQMVTDKNIGGKTLSVKKKITVDFPQVKVNVSDIELLSSFVQAPVPGPLTRNGYDLLPYMADFFYPEDVKEITFYAEVYNTKAILGENEKFLISYYIESYERNSALSQYSAFRKETTGPVSILLSKFNIAELPSGNYNLVVDIRNKSNESVARKKVFFQRKNPGVKTGVDPQDLASITVENTFASRITGKDTLKEYLRSLRPVASPSEKGFLDNQLKLADEKLMQQFLYNFWQSRNPLAPEEGWVRYCKEVKAVNAKFGTYNYRGYETDRGRVYLQYGPPDKMEQYPSEPNAYPYEIWGYYTLSDKSKLNPSQNNKQFIFFNREQATNNYQILHSDALSETHDDNWQMKLHARTVQSNDFEHKTAPEHFGGNAAEDFRNPK